jgi:16S rRNA (guanine1516-N2)-methyltransferase
VVSCWKGVDPSQQVITRAVANEKWPWIEVLWDVNIPEKGIYFFWDSDGLHLKSRDYDSRSSVHVDFLVGQQARRLKAVSGEALTRAVGCQKGFRPVVFDTTAGLGGDASVLANVGCEVFAIERNPLIAALLADAVRRAREAELHWVSKFQLIHQDARELLASVNHGVVYLDPMFVKQRKSAPNLAMQIFHDLPGTSDDSEFLLEAALDSGAARVVVKRPIKAPPLSGCAPQSEVCAKTVRFDLYPKRKLTENDLISPGIQGFGK